MTSVAIVILNYNGGALLRQCVESFLQLRHEKFRIIVVDNCSVDGSADGLEQLDSKVQVVRSTENLGYTGGNNLGIEVALQDDFEYVLLVNNDTLVCNPRFLTEMIAFAETNADAGILGPKVFFRKEGIVQNTICATPFFLKALLKWPQQKFAKIPSNKSGDEFKQVDVLNGVCLLLKSSMLREIGILDPLIFMYREDTDLAIRARKRGWNSYYIPIQSIVHLQKSIGYEYNSMVDFLLKRNAVYVLRKHGYGLSAAGRAISSLSLSAGRALLSYIRSRDTSQLYSVRLLYKAMIAIFSGKYHSNSFGPPVRSWSELHQGND